MTTVIAYAYLWYWWATWSTSAFSTQAYRQRVLVALATAMYFLVAGDVQKSFPGFIAEWVILGEGVFMACRFNDMDPLLWGKRI